MTIRVLNNNELKELHKIQLLMLDEVDRICRKHGIKYIISGGTLLGAIRHKGFIPWDDDIDVRMDRVEYEKFCSVCNEELDTEKFFFQTYKTDKNYPWFFGKLRYNYSKYIRVGQEHLKMNNGIFIDIFPTDGVPNHYFSRLIVLKICQLLKKILYSEVGKISESNRIKRYMYKCINLIPRKCAYHILEIISKCFIGEKYKFVADYSFTNAKWDKEYTERKWLLNLIEVEFENKLYFTTYAYDEWLSIDYGNYMQLPPVDKRTGNNSVVYFEIADKNLQ